MSQSASQILTELAEVAGWDAAIKIADMRGGTQIRIPQEPAPEHWLWDLLGEQAARAISARYGGSCLWVPKNDADSLRMRNEQIRADRRAGATINALAQRYRLTDRQIYSILRIVEG